MSTEGVSFADPDGVRRVVARLVPEGSVSAAVVGDVLRIHRELGGSDRLPTDPTVRGALARRVALALYEDEDVVLAARVPEARVWCQTNTWTQN